MKAGGSPMHIMTRDEVLEMWSAREAERLLEGLFEVSPALNRRTPGGSVRLP